MQERLGAVFGEKTDTLSVKKHTGKHRLSVVHHTVSAGWSRELPGAGLASGGGADIANLQDPDPESEPCTELKPKPDSSSRMAASDRADEFILRSSVRLVPPPDVTSTSARW